MNLFKESENKKKEAEELRKKLHYHNNKYYILDDPEITDAEYDKIFTRLKEIEEMYPSLKTADSPTQRVGSKPFKQFKTVHHPTPAHRADRSRAPRRGLIRAYGASVRNCYRAAAKRSASA